MSVRRVTPRRVKRSVTAAALSRRNLNVVPARHLRCVCVNRDTTAGPMTEVVALAELLPLFGSSAPLAIVALSVAAPALVGFAANWTDAVCPGASVPSELLV